MMRVGGAAAGALLGVAVVGLAGCGRSDNQASAGQAYAADRTTARTSGYGDEGTRAPIPMFHGEPMWSENRRHTAKENAEYHFQRDGQALGAHTLDDFLTKTHQFGDHPPAGTLKLTRSNGDKLLYNPKANLFGVFTADGAPRTIFKPPEGMAYWTAQKAREADGGGYHRRSTYGGGGEGSGEG
jgi:hypothetical protein